MPGQGGPSRLPNTNAASLTSEQILAADERAIEADYSMLDDDQKHGKGQAMHLTEEDTKGPDGK